MNNKDIAELIDEIRQNPGITKSLLSSQYYNDVGARHTIAKLLTEGVIYAVEQPKRKSAKLYAASPKQFVTEVLSDCHAFKAGRFNGEHAESNETLFRVWAGVPA